MLQAKKHGGLFDLDIQLFAEPSPNPNGNGNGDGGNPNPDNTPKQKYSDEEYLKLKASFDKTSSEIAELKKQLKGKQTDDEKKAQEEAEKQQEMDNLKKEVATYKIKNSLQESFEKDEVEKITKAIIDGDIDSLVKNLNEIRKAYKEKIYKEAKEEFSKSSKIPGGNGSDDADADVQAYIDRKKAKQSDARNYYFGGGKKAEK